LITNRYQRLCRLLAGAALALALAAPARAQMPVIDNAAIAQLLNQLRTAEQQYQELVASYNQLVTIYRALSQLTNINSIATELEQPWLQNPAPNTTLLPGILNGLSPPSVLGGNLANLAQQYLGQNRVYQPQGTDFEAGQLSASANSTAEIEAIATQNLQALQVRATALTQIQNQLNSASTIQQVASIQARLAAEQNYVQIQTAQAENLRILAAARIETEDEAQQQAERQSEEQGIQAACNALSQLGSSSQECQ
jgi:Type IV secretion system proteins